MQLQHGVQVPELVLALLVGQRRRREDLGLLREGEGQHRTLRGRLPHAQDRHCGQVRNAKLKRLILPMVYNLNYLYVN